MWDAVVAQILLDNSSLVGSARLEKVVATFCRLATRNC